jgi:hypothetical protein
MTPRVLLKCVPCLVFTLAGLLTGLLFALDEWPLDLSFTDLPPGFGFVTESTIDAFCESDYSYNDLFFTPWCSSALVPGRAIPFSK